MTETTNNADYWTLTASAAMNMTCGDGIPITIRHDDGRVYHGCVNEHGEKHGQGTLKMDVCVTGTVGDESSHTVRWTEFSGSWRNGVMHGYGVMSRMTETGVDYVAHDGMWDDGVPIIHAPIIHAPIINDEENEDEDEDEEASWSWQQMYAESDDDDDDDEYHNNNNLHNSPGYDHHEEAS
jgi:hypothetical protein